MSEVQAILATLEQAPVIQQEHASRWLEGIMRYHRSRAEWHAKRLKGIGGSEMGAVLRGLYGIKESGFSTLRRVVEQKLMMRMPEFETIHMKRGTVLEPLARLAFLYRYKAQRDVAAMKATAEAKSKPGYEWLVGNPDDLVILNNKRFVTDYKVPNKFDHDIAYDYSVQLHHYALLSQMAGVKIDGLILAKLDLSPELANSLVEKMPTMQPEQVHEIAKTIARMDMPGLRVVGMVVDMERSMRVDILDAGATAWNDYVVSGVVPPKPREQLVELDDQRMLEIGNLQQQYAMAKAGINYLTKQCKSVEAEITATLQGVDVSDKALPLSLVKVSPKRPDKEAIIKEAKALGATPQELADGQVYSVVALLEEIKRLQGDPVAPHLFAEPEPSADKAGAYLESLNIDVNDFADDGITLRMSTTKKDKEVGALFERAAAEQFGSWLDQNTLEAKLAEEDSLEAYEDFDLEAVSGTLSEVFAGAESAEPNSNPSTPKLTSASMR